MTKTRFVFVTVATALLSSALYWCFGLFIVHPLGASSEGATYLFWRPGSEMPFISSADGLLLQKSDAKKKEPITADARGAALGKTSDFVLKRRLLKLPYSRELYLHSTGGVNLDQ
jgi:hypothetical protein